MICMVLPRKAEGRRRAGGCSRVRAIRDRSDLIGCRRQCSQRWEASEESYRKRRYLVEVEVQRLKRRFPIDVIVARRGECVQIDCRDLVVRRVYICSAAPGTAGTAIRSKDSLLPVCPSACLPGYPPARAQESLNLHLRVRRQVRNSAQLVVRYFEKI